MSLQDTQTRNADPRNKSTLESDIHGTRYRLDQTLTELQGKLSPQYLMNETFDYFRYGGPAQFSGNLGDSVKNNPVPFVLTTVGLGWLMLAPRNGPTHHDLGQSNPTPSASGDNLSSPSHGNLDASKDKAQSAAAGVRDGAHNMKTSMDSRSAQMRDGSRAAAQSASRGARNATTQTVHFVQTNPLAAAGIALGVGTALGSLFPASRVENEQLGELRDDLVDKAGDAGVAQAARLQSKVDEKAEQARPDHARSSGDSSASATGRSPSENLTRHANDSSTEGDRTSARQAPGADTSENTTPGEGRSTTINPEPQTNAPPPGARQTPGDDRRRS